VKVAALWPVSELELLMSAAVDRRIDCAAKRLSGSFVIQSIKERQLIELIYLADEIDGK
jgi:hypothetical protein